LKLAKKVDIQFANNHGESGFRKTGKFFLFFWGPEIIRDFAA
jgi:hypothetical protein